MLRIQVLEKQFAEAVARLTTEQQEQNVRLAEHGERLCSAYWTFNTDCNQLENFNGYHETVLEALLICFEGVINSLEAN